MANRSRRWSWLTVFFAQLVAMPWAFGQIAEKTDFKALTIEQIYASDSLNGHLTRGMSWTPDSKRISYFQSSGSGKNQETELWAMDVATGEKQALIKATVLSSILPAEAKVQSQATGLGRRRPSRYQWTPDGSAILFIGPNALVWFDLKTQTGRSLISGEEELADPKISPNGRYVSFVRDHNLWIVAIQDAKVRAITTGGTEAVRKGELDWVYPEELGNSTAYWWAPDSSAIAYYEMNESKVNQYPLVDFESFSGQAELERYPIAGDANPVVRVFVAPLKNAETKLMDTGAEQNVYLPRVNWLPDSRHLAIQRLNRAQTSLDLLIADSSSGKSRVALNEKDAYWVNIHDDLNFLNDGRFIWSSERSGYRHLYLYDLQGRQLAQITKGDWEVSGVEAIDQQKGLVYFSATEKSPIERQLYRVNLDGSGFQRVTRDSGTHHAKLSPDWRTMIDTFSTTEAPPREYLLHADGSPLAIINENKVPELAAFQLSPVEFFSVTSHDSQQLSAMMIKPPNFNPQRRYPVIVHTYGGPGVQLVTNSWGGPNFLWHEMMAQKGYIIFELDNRGSSGRGHVFEEPLHFRMGAQELSDQRDGVGYLKTLPYVDASRIGIWGWSYGGHMTLHAMFEDPEEFKVGVAGGPVTDWHYYDTIYTERYLGLLPENEESYQESSPIQNAAKLRGKLLIAHGTGDDNVHYANTLALLNALIDAGKYVEVITFPGRGHGISDAEGRKLLMERITKFFTDNL